MPKAPVSLWQSSTEKRRAGPVPRGHRSPWPSPRCKQSFVALSESRATGSGMCTDSLMQALLPGMPACRHVVYPAHSTTTVTRVQWSHINHLWICAVRCGHRTSERKGYPRPTKPRPALLHQDALNTTTCTNLSSTYCIAPET
jgi:hypothetical protein